MSWLGSGATAGLWGRAEGAWQVVCPAVGRRDWGALWAAGLWAFTQTRAQLLWHSPCLPPPCL